MNINYRMEDNLPWSDAEWVKIKAKGWKEVKITFIDSYPHMFWRINDIPHVFNSKSDIVARKGVYDFFTGNLESLKQIIEYDLPNMAPERKRFYEENILELFE